MAQSLAKVITHITSSTKHHGKATFQDELRELYGVEFDERYVWE